MSSRGCMRFPSSKFIFNSSLDMAGYTITADKFILPDGSDLAAGELTLRDASHTVYCHISPTEMLFNPSGQIAFGKPITAPQVNAATGVFSGAVTADSISAKKGNFSQSITTPQLTADTGTILDIKGNTAEIGAVTANSLTTDAITGNNGTFNSGITADHIQIKTCTNLPHPYYKYDYPVPLIQQNIPNHSFLIMQTSFANPDVQRIYEAYTANVSGFSFQIGMRTNRPNTDGTFYAEICVDTGSQLLVAYTTPVLPVPFNYPPDTGHRYDFPKDDTSYNEKWYGPIMSMPTGTWKVKVYYDGTQPEIYVAIWCYMWVDLTKTIECEENK